jgi:hypothetical protein
MLDDVDEIKTEIAFAVGLIKEIPIPLCSNDYNERSITFHGKDNDGGTTIPISSIKAHPINLYCVEIRDHHQKLVPALTEHMTFPIRYYDSLMAKPLHQPPAAVC